MRHEPFIGSFDGRRHATSIYWLMSESLFDVPLKVLLLEALLHVHAGLAPCNGWFVFRSFRCHVCSEHTVLVLMLLLMLVLVLML